MELGKLSQRVERNEGGVTQLRKLTSQITDSLKLMKKQSTTSVGIPGSGHGKCPEAEHLHEEIDQLRSQLEQHISQQEA